MAGVKIEELGNTSDDEAYGTPTHDAQQDETNAQFHDPSFEPAENGPNQRPETKGVQKSEPDNKKVPENPEKISPSIPTSSGQNTKEKEDEDDSPELNEKEQEELAKAEEMKAKGNDFFKKEQYTEALEAYDEAIKVSPIKALEQKAVYYANRAQVYLNLKQYQEAVKEASASLNLRPTDAIKIKALARRAQAYEGLKDIVRAYYDYEKVVELDSNSKYRSDMKRLKPLVDAEQEKTKEEMLSKLKDLGNTVLGKFGMSLDNFKAEKDPKTGQYSISMQQ